MILEDFFLKKYESHSINSNKGTPALYQCIKGHSSALVRNALYMLAGSVLLK